MKVKVSSFIESKDGINVLLVQGNSKDYIIVWSSICETKVQIPMGTTASQIRQALSSMSEADVFHAGKLYTVLNNGD